MTWLDALRQTLQEFQGRTFEWGEVDCCQLASAYVRRLTGDDHASTYCYASAYEATDYLDSRGGMAGMLDQFLERRDGAPEPGDVVVVDIARAGDPEIESVGIYNGHFVFSIVEGHDLVRVPEERIQAAWGVQWPAV